MSFEVGGRFPCNVSKLMAQQLRGGLIKLLGEKFEEFDSAASPAKTVDAWLHERGERDGAQGRAFEADEVKPWDAVVAGDAVLDEIAEIIDSYVYLSAEGRDACALWAVFSHAFDAFNVSPLLDLHSPTKRCGKTSLASLMRRLCRQPLPSSNITPAALFRSIEAWKPTLIIDEADTFATMSDELRGIINSGHTRDLAFVIRAEGDANEPRMFSTWAPKLVAAIGHLPDTVEDRAIRVGLTRKPTSVTKKDAFDGEAVAADCEPARRRLVRFVLDNLDAIAAAPVTRPPGLNDRAWNNWRPLMAIAVVAGGEWPARAAAAAKALSENGEDGNSEDLGTLALRHVWEAVEPAGKLPTVDVLHHLIEKDEGPWARWWESSIARGELKSPSSRLAKLLSPFGIKPKQLWIGEHKTRGYEAADFMAEHVRTYLEKDGRDGRNGRTASLSHAGSTVPTVPTVFSEGSCTHDFPRLGDADYPAALRAAHENGHVTEKESASALAVHQLVASYRGVEPDPATASLDELRAYYEPLS